MNATVQAAWRFRRKTGLVLTAGGARGAYQAGVLKRIGEIKAFRNGPSPFPIVAGASAGAINGAGVAGYSANFRHGTEMLAELWGQLRAQDVYRTDLIALIRNGARLAMDLALGPVFGAGRLQSLLDTAPLRPFLAQHLPLEGIGEAIRLGQLYAVAITATGYHSGKSFTFIQGKPGHPTWTKSRRISLPVSLTVDHICASASIPVVFPPAPVMVSGAVAYFGDGALRLVTPLSPAIRLGADRILAIGVRCRGSAEALTRAELATAEEATASPLKRPPLSQICGVFMNAIFLDHLDADVDHLVRMNGLLAGLGGNTPGRPAADGTVREPMRHVEPLAISPSEDLAIIANSMKKRIPATVRYLLDALGTPDAQSADLTSYLLFDAAFTRELIRIGYHDAEQRIDEIEHFLTAADARGLRQHAE